MAPENLAPFSLVTVSFYGCSGHQQPFFGSQAYNGESRLYAAYPDYSISVRTRPREVEALNGLGCSSLEGLQAPLRFEAVLRGAQWGCSGQLPERVTNLDRASLSVWVWVSDV